MVLTETSTDYSNRILGSQKEQVRQMDREETLQKDNMLFSSQEFSQKLQKENMTLMKALAHRNKIIELSGIEFQKLRVQLQNMQEKNLELARANSQMLAELNTNRDRLKELQHELGCKNALLKVNKQLEEKTLLSTHASKDKDMNHKDTKRKRTSRIKPSGISDVNPIHMNESTTSKRKLSEVIDTTGIPEETYQTEDDNGKGVISSGVNQIVDTVMNKNVHDAANPVKHNVHSKRQGTRRQSTRFDVQQTVQIEKSPEMDEAKEFKETARLSLRRQSARLRPEEAEPCKSFQNGDEVRETTKTRRLSLRRQSARLRPEDAEPCKSFQNGDEVRETTKTRRLSSRKLSAMFDSKEPEVTETLKADDDTRSLISEESLASRSEAVEPSESRHDIKETNRKRRVSTRKQSTIGKYQTDEAIKETATNTSPGKNIVQECDKETETKKKLKADEDEGMIRRTSVRRPSRHAAEKVQSYKEVSLKVKMRRN